MTFHEGAIQSPEEFQFTERIARYIDEIQQRPFVHTDESDVSFSSLPVTRQVAEIISAVQSPYALKPPHLLNTDLHMFAGKGKAKLPLSETTDIETDSFLTAVGLEWKEPGEENVNRLLTARFFSFDREKRAITWTSAENATNLYIGINVAPGRYPYFSVFRKGEVADNPKSLAFPIAHSLYLPYNSSR